MAKDTWVKLSVDTQSINDKNKEEKVIFSDNRDEDPSNYSGKFQSTVDKNREIYWEGIAMNKSDEVSIINVYKTGGSEIMEDIKKDPKNTKKFKAKIKNKDIKPPEDYKVTIQINGGDTFTLDPKLIMNN